MRTVLGLHLRRRAARLAALTLILVAVVANNSSPAIGAPALPAGFTRTEIATGIPAYQLTNFVFLPSGEMLVTGKCGAVRRVGLDGSSSPVASIAVNCVGDRGLLGFDLAPDFASSRTVYTLYNYRRADNKVWARLSRWTANDANEPTSLSNEVVILDDLPSFSSTGATCDDSHTIGTVVAAPDGSLYVGNGDASSYCAVDASAFATYDLTSPRGKILRINSAGAGVPSNPYFESANPNSWRSRVFAYGVRNPFRFAQRPGTDTLYLGDVGWTAYEEISVTKAGSNLGWPCWEGPLSYRNSYASRSECVNAYGTMTPAAPLHAWNHAGGDAAAVGGAFYEGETYPADYRGAFFFGDYGLRRIWTVRTNAADQVVRAPESGGFGTDIGSPVAFRTGPNGDIFYADLVSSNVYRLRYAPGNRAPVAQIFTDRTAGAAPLAVRFDGTVSYDLDGEVLTYAWNFGDGATATGVDVSHTYATNGVYAATLTVTDQLGVANTATVQITVGNSPPVLTVQEPPSGTSFAVGDTFDLPATATDPEDGALPPSAITFRTLQRHCPYGGTCHAHPGPLTGEQQEPGRLVCLISDHGDDSFVEVLVTATDSQGATATKIVNVAPRYRTLTISSSTGDVPITVNSSTNVAYPSFRLVAGSQNSVTAPATYGNLTFVAWSDGGPRDRIVTMPDADLTLTAIYRSAPVAVASATPSTGRPPLVVSFSSAGSVDPDGTGITYAWNFGDGSPVSTAANPTHTYTAAGSFVASLTVTDESGATGQATVPITVVASPPGLVAAYGFEETSGSAIADSSAAANNGTMNAGATRNATGHAGRALTFNGTSGSVTVPDSTSLDLTSAFTLSAWVRPTAVTNWRTIVLKETGAGLAYALYGGDDAGRAAGYVSLGGADRGATATSALPTNTWTHVTTTYDGSAVRLYIGAALVATTNVTGTIPISASPLKIGGNAVWGEWFAGTIDDVRVYNRALNLTEITTDMNTPVGQTDPPPPDLQPPSTPVGLTTNVSGTTITSGWSASTDNVGVNGYDIHRGTTDTFTPSAASLVGTSTTTGFVDSNRPPGDHYYRIIARDAAGNVSAPSVAARATVAGDISPPTTPGALNAAGGIGRIDLTWTASTDDVGVTGYDIHRATASNFTATAANRVATVAGVTFADTGLTPGTYHYRVIARDAALRSSAPTPSVAATVVADQPPTVQVTAPVAGGVLSGTVVLTATAADDVGVDAVQFRVDGVDVGAEDTSAPYAFSWPSTSVANGAHIITAVARDANRSTATSAAVNVTVNNGPPPSGLVAAYGFNEATGVTVTDSSGRGNAGTISGATRSAGGRFGGAVSFDGINDFVAIPDSSSLDLNGSITISAWVRPTTISGWRTVVLKEGGAGGLTYALYSSTLDNRPGGYLEIGGLDRELKSSASVSTTAWRHLALTYDGTTMRMFIDGVQQGSRAQVGSIAVSTGALKIGGNAVWGEWYSGLIDDVRIHNRALSASELTTLMGASV